VKLLNGEIGSGETVRVSAEAGEMKFSPVGGEQRAAV